MISDSVRDQEIGWKQIRKHQPGKVKSHSEGTAPILFSGFFIINKRFKTNPCIPKQPHSPAGSYLCSHLQGFPALPNSQCLFPASISFLCPLPYRCGINLSSLSLTWISPYLLLCLRAGTLLSASK